MKSRNYNPGIVICTRLDSQRLPRKVMEKIGDKTILEHMIERLLPAKLPICLAYPEDEGGVFTNYIGENVMGFAGSKENVLERFYKAAELYSFDPVIRITHDNIMQFADHIEDAFLLFEEKGADYLTIPNGVPGTKFEIISFGLLGRVYEKNKECNTELLSFLFREFSEKKTEYMMLRYPPQDDNLNFAIDYPEDLSLLRIIHEQGWFGTSSSWKQMLEHYLLQNRYLMTINKRPLISVYTCAYNAKSTIIRAIKSVESQSFTNWEYIIYDDGSDDGTSLEILEYAKKKNMRLKLARGSENIGLTKSANYAIKYTRGKYILRLDADDEFHPESLRKMIDKIGDCGILYSGYIKDRKHCDPNFENIGCALVRRDVWEEIGFREDLEYCDGLDFYMRATNVCKIAKTEFALWKYHQRPDSMSATGGEKREAIRQEIFEENDNIIHVCDWWGEAGSYRYEGKPSCSI